jgi:hypothetical protein
MSALSNANNEIIQIKSKVAVVVNADNKAIPPSNPYNMIRATLDGLSETTAPKLVAAKRDLKIGDLVRRRGDSKDQQDQDQEHGYGNDSHEA